ncbi:hypothetical protein BJV82DRAFT_517176 [Fennellomyces sp. T-0311]|nr:hypothetical protein BJV82DRAFT_517176 [Fennellomyces sp. T-0311]
MGAQTSREAARRLPTQARRETLAKPATSPSTLHDDHRSAEAQPEPAEDRDQSLHEKLIAMGQVKVEPTVTRMRTSDNMLHIIRERQRIEEDEDLGRLSKVPNRTTIDELFSVLEQRKRLTPGALDSSKVLEDMSRDYHLDVPTLKSLFKYYGTMAVLPARADDPHERRRGIWVNNKQEWESALDAANAKNQELKLKMKPAATAEPKKKERELTVEEKREKRLQDLFEE